MADLVLQPKDYWNFAYRMAQRKDDEGFSRTDEPGAMCVVDGHAIKCAQVSGEENALDFAEAWWAAEKLLMKRGI